MPLSTEGQKAYEKFSRELHKLAGVAEGKQFALSPRVLQTLNDKVVIDGNWFTGLINVMSVPDLIGQKIYMAIDRLTSSRTNTNVPGRERTPRSLHGLDDSQYMLHQTNSDIAIAYSVIDAWKFFADFFQRYQRLFRGAIANDRLRVGWHGVSAELDTDPVANPNGEDVNIGWLQHIRLADNGTGKNYQSGVTIGQGGDVANLDSLASQARNDLVDEEFRDHPDLRVLVSRDLIGMEEGKYYEAAGDKASEKIHMDNGRILQTYGGMQALSPPFFPDGTLSVTWTKNLSIYHQEDSWRRTVKEKPEKNQVEDFNSRNEGYVVENTGGMALVENITPAGTSAPAPSAT